VKPVLYPWQQESWQQLQQLRARLPHAILFYGTQGIGKTAFVETFAQSLLCETPESDGHACGVCEACGWFVQYSHPDYRRVRPEMLEEGDASETEDDTEVKKTKSTKAPSKEIKIDQIRALSDFLNVSTHRSGLRVITLYPAEALNTIAANSLLKMLEEPPAHTMFLLVSNSIDHLLPTILSRCRQFALPMPSSEQASSWLKMQEIKEADAWLSEQGGAPLAALAASQSGEREMLDEFLQLLRKPDAELVLKTAERLQKVAVGELVACQQRWLYDVLSVKLSGTIRYYPRYQKDLTALAQRTDSAVLLRSIKQLSDRRMIATHPLAPKLFIEDMLLDYLALFS
tara:strand:+ start:39980 stop:41008 length:1029 start_codon:yes stop_codon:yes gene_type:complete